MPYKCDTQKLLIPKDKDRRVKLSQEDKEEIRYRYLEIGGVSQRELAREYGVSKRLIQFCIYPEKQKENYMKRMERGGSRQYYDREKHTESVRNTRRYRKELCDKGELITPEGDEELTKQRR